MHIKEGGNFPFFHISSQNTASYPSIHQSVYCTVCTCESTFWYVPADLVAHDDDETNIHSPWSSMLHKRKRKDEKNHFSAHTPAKMMPLLYKYYGIHVIQILVQIKLKKFSRLCIYCLASSIIYTYTDDCHDTSHLSLWRNFFLLVQPEILRNKNESTILGFFFVVLLFLLWKIL